MSASRLDPAALRRPGAAPAAPQQATQPEESWAAPLRSTFRFLSIPVFLLAPSFAFGIELPVIVLYLIAGIMGMVLFFRSLRDAEWLLAVFVMYIPLARIYVVPVAPGINGTNALLIMMIVAWIARVRREKRPFFTPMQNTRLVAVWGVLSFFSFITSAFTLGMEHLIDHLGMLKIWVDQFLIFYCAINLIRDRAMAKRLAVYLMVGATIVYLFAFLEWFDKRDAANMEKARLLGPQLQPNDLGAFIVYSSSSFIALFVLYGTRLKTWLLLPQVAMMARVLLATFSRGAYIGFGLMTLMAMYLRSRLMPVALACIGALAVAVAPSLLPDSLTARMGQTQDAQGEGGVDKSSGTRLILWKAAIDMTLESPILGKGFATFMKLKGQYTEEEVHEADNHNMYLYICSQMGIPALVTFLLIIWRLHSQGKKVYKAATDGWERTIGLSCAALAVGVAGVNMFGSRMVDACVMAYVWLHLAVITHLWHEQKTRLEAEAAEKKKQMRKLP